MGGIKYEDIYVAHHDTTHSKRRDQPKTRQQDVETGFLHGLQAHITTRLQMKAKKRQENTVACLKVQKILQKPKNVNAPHVRALSSQHAYLQESATRDRPKYHMKISNITEVPTHQIIHRIIQRETKLQVSHLPSCTRIVPTKYQR